MVELGTGFTIRSFFLWGFVCTYLICGVNSARAQSSEIIDAARDSISILHVTYSDSSCRNKQGSAFFISDLGYALTAAHVVQPSDGCLAPESRKIWARVGYSRTGDKIPVEFVDDLDRRDLALVRFAERRAGYLPITFCLQRQPERRDYVGLGFPEGADYGNVLVRYQHDGEGLWIGESPKVPGMSGGPMIDSFGRAIGVIKGARSRTTDVGKYIIPLSFAEPLIRLAGAELRSCREEGGIPEELPLPPGFTLTCRYTIGPKRGTVESFRGIIPNSRAIRIGEQCTDGVESFGLAIEEQEAARNNGLPAGKTLTCQYTRGSKRGQVESFLGIVPNSRAVNVGDSCTDGVDSTGVAVPQN